MLKFSPANVKIKALKAVAALAKYLPRGRRVYSFDLQSGRTCPFAKICRSRVKEIDGKRKIVDGPYTTVRCFSASQEATYTNVYKLRKHNADILMAMGSEREIFDALNAALPKNAGVVRIHVAGDFFNQDYFDAWVMVAMANPNVLFYAYTKSLRYWVSRIGIIPANMILTASEGGSEDYLINKHNLRKAVIVFSEQVAADMELEIDHTDEHAANPEMANEDFALLLHGIQPAGSEAAAAIREMKRNGTEFAYSR